MNMMKTLNNQDWDINIRGNEATHLPTGLVFQIENGEVTNIRSTSNDFHTRQLPKLIDELISILHTSKHKAHKELPRESRKSVLTLKKKSTCD
jgi:hypothetical protein